jgi:hypothetical protein
MDGWKEGLEQKEDRVEHNEGSIGTQWRKQE